MKARTLHIRHALFLCAFIFGIVGVSWGQVSAGFNTSFVVLSLNSGANTYYDLQASTSNTDFNGASLGSFTAGTNNLLLKGAEHNVYKCGGADLTSTRVYYRIYLTSAGVSGSFTSTDIGYSSGGNNGCGGQDQQWRNLNYSTNLLSGLAPGNYSIQVYSDATITCCGGTALADNSGNNYTATFTVTGNYYSKSTGNLELTSSWGTNTDGTGNVPVNFTTAGNTFNIRNNATPTIGASWTVSGTGTKIVVGDGTNACNFTVPSTFTVTSPTTEVLSNGTLTFEASGALTATTVTNNGSIVMTSGGTLTIAAGGTLTNNATFTGGSGTISFAGAGTVNGSNAITFNNLTINAGTLTLTTVPTIDGTLRINNGNLSTAPRYSSNSTLLYNTTYSRFNEWNATGIGTIGTTPGYPNHVTINSGIFTVLNLDAGTARALNGTLTIASGATFATGALNALITVGGDIVNNGTIQMSTTNARIKCVNFNNASGASVTLSSTIGGDLEVSGDIVDNGTFNSYNRAIFFTGSIVQNISGSGTFNIDYIVSNKSGGSIKLHSNLLCEGPAGGNAMDLSTSNDIIDLNGYTFTINGAISGSGQINASSGTVAFGNASNLSLPTSLFTGNVANIAKTAGAGTVTLNDNLTITGDLTTTASTGAFVVAASKELTINGTLTNNGTFTLESGATFMQGTSILGNGTFNVKQAISGANNGTAPNGRFWYMGVPMSGLTKGTAFGTVSGPTETKVWGFTETAANGWGSNLSSSIGLQETKGYAIRTGESNPTFTFSGNNLFSSDTTISLSYTNGFGNGFHLMCNSYMAPISWEAIYGASNNINATYWVRSYNGSSLTLDFDTYNAASNQSVNPSNLLTNEYIAPLQSFWVRSLPNTINQSITLAKSMTEHQTANVLKSSIDFPVFARVNLVDDNKFDQTLIYMDQNMSTAIDAYDSEKMFVSGKVQIYTKVGNNKLVMNGLRNNKKKITVPLYLEVPTSKIYELHLSEFNMEEGLILLEDKQEGVIQDFTINEAYIFYSNSGSITNRFVLHFYMPDASVTAQGPSNFWAGESVTYTESGSVLINSNARGYIQITIDSELQDEINGTYTIVDANGGLVTTGKLDGPQTDFELTIPSGIYYLTVNCGSVQEIKKVFIQN